MQSRRWQDQFPDAPPLSVHVNLSGRQLEEQRPVGEVVQALEMSRLSPRLLTLEITESVLVADIEAMSARLRELKGLGVLLAIDDFGTGYSSLSYLRRFPIDRASSTPSRRPTWPPLGCRDGQGYLFARPLPVGAMTELLARCMADGGFYLPAATAVEAAAAT